jgi:surface polysaccharide O-acyltransferase-like enzyme
MLVVLPYADGLRVIAMVAIIALHDSAIRVAHLPEINSFPWRLTNIIDSMSRSL